MALLILLLMITAVIRSAKPLVSYLHIDLMFLQQLLIGTSTGTMCLKAVIRPFTRHFMGRLAIADKYKRASLKMGCSWYMEYGAAHYIVVR